MLTLNVNSIRNKFESVSYLIKDNFDIFLISESKLDSSFPNSQFSIPGYRLFRNDRDKHGGGLIFYVNEDLPCKKLTNFDTSLEITALKINLGKLKWLFLRLYKPPSFKDEDFTSELNNIVFFGEGLEEH